MNLVILVLVITAAVFLFRKEGYTTAQLNDVEKFLNNPLNKVPENEQNDIRKFVNSNGTLPQPTTLDKYPILKTILNIQNQAMVGTSGMPRGFSCQFNN